MVFAQTRTRVSESSCCTVPLYPVVISQRFPYVIVPLLNTEHSCTPLFLLSISCGIALCNQIRCLCKHPQLANNAPSYHGPPVKKYKLTSTGIAFHIKSLVQILLCPFARSFRTFNTGSFFLIIATGLFSQGGNVCGYDTSSGCVLLLGKMASFLGELSRLHCSVAEDRLVWSEA